MDPLTDALTLHLAGLLIQCAAESDASVMENLHNALEARCITLRADYRTVCGALALPPRLLTSQLERRIEVAASVGECSGRTT
jgi:hypothetical protein